MSIQPITDFVNRFKTRITLDKDLVLKKRNRYFLLSHDLGKLAFKDFFYAGVYLGKTKNGKFFPGFSLLDLIADTEANKVFVDKRTEWLFICGRDIFNQGITETVGSRRKGDYTLALNQHGECLGFGVILHDLDEVEHRVAVKNVSDIGDFLRREK